ncbi:MAG TPA: GNAT family N-acetyltransferase [Myxococcales bacterium]|nr:GNAT family N-acetyltransferase [Myxococcales bacterium]
MPGWRTPMGRYHFDERYREHARLADGRDVRLRMIKPEDKPLFVEALKRLSPASRYARFLSAKSSLSQGELRYLTELDGRDHFALGALTGLGRERRGLGVARFVRLHDEPDVADAAIVVTDDAQGQGLGRLLFLRLVAAARERGVDRFRCDVLAENDRMRALLHEIAPAARDQPDGVAVTVDVPLLDVAVDAPSIPGVRGPLYRLFSLAATGVLRVLRTREGLRSLLAGDAHSGRKR